VLSISDSDHSGYRLMGGEVKDRHKMAQEHTCSKIRIKISSSNIAIVRVGATARRTLKRNYPPLY
jgi:hypothetical protein